MGPSKNDLAQKISPACNLPMARRPQRMAEFGKLFTGAVRGVERAGARRLRLDLRPGPEVAGRTAELVAAETGCCSFFTFVLTIAADRLVLEVTVPEAGTGMLDALARRAAASAGTGSAGEAVDGAGR